MPAPTIHASCIAFGAVGVLLRGPSGVGKSTLALRLILDPPRALPPAELVADDRVHLEAVDGGVEAFAPPILAGLMEVRHLGIRRLPHRPRVRLALVVDLAAPAARLPEPGEGQVMLCGNLLCRIAVPLGSDGALMIAAALRTEKS